MSILIFLLVLFALILVHEWGHFIVAKKMGMRVDEFGIGFPPKLFGIQKGETEYSINALPIGGFVRIYGEDEVDVEESADADRAFARKGKWAQTAVLIAGVFMNVVFAWLLFAIAFSVGTQQLVSESEASDSAKLLITEVVPDSPAADAGLTRNALVTEMSTNGESVGELTPSSIVSFIEAHQDDELSVTYSIAGQEKTTTLEAKEGVIPEEPEREVIGVGFGLIDVVSKPIHLAIYEGLVSTLTGLRDITVGISALLADAVMFEADLSNVAGPVGIVDLVGEASALGVTTLLMFTAFISLNLAVINLLPFPALDGGRLLFVIIEAIKGSPIKPQLAHALNAAGFVLLILLMIAITYNDIMRLM